MEIDFGDFGFGQFGAISVPHMTTALTTLQILYGTHYLSQARLVVKKITRENAVGSSFNKVLAQSFRKMCEKEIGRDVLMALEFLYFRFSCCSPGQRQSF